MNNLIEYGIIIRKSRSKKGNVFGSNFGPNISAFSDLLLFLIKTRGTK